MGAGAAAGAAAWGAAGLALAAGAAAFFGAGLALAFTAAFFGAGLALAAAFFVAFFATLGAFAALFPAVFRPFPEAFLAVFAMEITLLAAPPRKWPILDHEATRRLAPPRFSRRHASQADSEAPPPIHGGIVDFSEADRNCQAARKHPGDADFGAKWAYPRRFSTTSHWMFLKNASM
jgi:hypothetical protein